MEPEEILENWEKEYKEKFEIIEKDDRYILAITREESVEGELKKYGRILKKFEGEDIIDDLEKYGREELEGDMIREKINKLSRSTGVFLDIEKLSEREYILNMKCSEGNHPLNVLVLEDYESLYKALTHFECLGGLTHKFWELRKEKNSLEKLKDAKDLFEKEFESNEILVDNL